MNFTRWLTQAVGRLADSDSPKRDAEILLGHVTGRARTFIMAFGETDIGDEHLLQLESLLCRREKGEPVAYLVGEREFWSLPLSVSPATLIPRPDTECLVEQALLRLGSASANVLDLGTGTGAIALAMASERPDCQFTGVDLQPEAVALAHYNGRKLQIANVQFLQGSWFTPLIGKLFKVIVSNPPYIDASDLHLTQGDVRFEPASALIADNKGLADIEYIVGEAPAFLESKGWLLLEHGWQQGESVRAILHSAGFTCVETVKDYGDNERVSLGQWPGSS